MIAVHNGHLSLKDRPGRLGIAVQPDEHLNLSDVQHVVPVDVIRRESRPSTHDSHEVWLANDSLPLVVENVVEVLSDPGSTLVRKLLFHSLLEHLELHEHVTEVVNANPLEKGMPLVHFPLKDRPGTDVRLNSRKSKNEVLYIHVVVDKFLQFVVFNLSAAILVNVLEHVTDVLCHTDFGRLGQSSQFCQPIDGRLKKL